MVAAFEGASTTATVTVEFAVLSSSGLPVPQNVTAVCSGGGTSITVSFDAAATASSYLISGIDSEPDERWGSRSDRQGFSVGGTARDRPYDVSVQYKTGYSATSDPSEAVRVVCRRAAPSGLSAICRADGSVKASWNRYFWDGTATAEFTVTFTAAPTDPGSFSCMQAGFRVGGSQSRNLVECLVPTQDLAWMQAQRQDDDDPDVWGSDKLGLSLDGKAIYHFSDTRPAGRFRFAWSSAYGGPFDY